MGDQSTLGDELTAAVSWLYSVGAMIVVGRNDTIHVYGSVPGGAYIHKFATKQSEHETGPDLLLRVIKEVREAHGS